MKRYKKAICLLLIFSISLSFSVTSALAVDPLTVGSIAGVGSIVVTFINDLYTLRDNMNGDFQRFLSWFDGGLVTDIEVGSGDQVGGYVFTAYATNRNWTSNNSVLVSFESLSDLVLTLNSVGVSCTLKTQSIVFNNSRMTVWVIIPHDQLIVDTAYGVAGFYQGPVLLANQSGYPYYAAASTDNTTSTNTNYNYYTQEGSPTTNNEYNYNSGDTVNNPIFKYGDEITENNQVYDYSSDSYVEVGDISYDASTKQYTTNITIDNSVHVQYNIDHTSITYIGSSAEDKTYNLYYELPDGRNSSELTAEDLEQLVLNYNVINYGVSADDGRLRALYHFDGDLEDSSYWSKYSKWDWISGASITYLESNAFGGSLYLDENAHQFTITLPSNFASSDFSVLFRYYHSADDGTNAGNDLVVSTGANTLWTITAGTATTSNVPVGQWTEIALIRDGTLLYCYVNGVVKAYVPITGTFGDTLTFSFSSGATYRQLDELRVYNFATSEAGVDYTPTAVPVDTNAVLILPDQATPVPDGYWDFNTDGNVLTYQDFSNGVDPSSMFTSVNTTSFSNYSVVGYTGGSSADLPTMTSGKFIYNNSYSSGSNTVYSNYFHIGRYNSVNFANFSQRVQVPVQFAGQTPVYTNTPYVMISSSQAQLLFYNGTVPAYVMPVASYDSGFRTTTNPYNITLSGDLSFSLVDLSGNQYSATIGLSNFKSSSFDAVIAGHTYSWGTMGLVLAPAFAQGGTSRGSILYAVISPSTSSGLDLVYMELKNGQPNDNTDAYVTQIYSDIDLTMPTVAIRSQIPIREYRIGGVRPTVPYRGDVWMMVENGHITSVQIYTGFAWQEVDLRIWTGQRWVSALYYNIMTQQDYTDILGTTDNEYIQSTEGFYSWLTKQFKELLAILNEISDQLEDIDSGGGTSLDFTFEIDGGTTVEFTKLADDGKVGMLRVVEPLYDILFAEAGTIYEGILAEFTALFDTQNSSVTIDGNDYYSVWYVFTAEPEVWNDATAA